MEHFPIVQALCRASLANPSPAIRKQIERLAGALSGGGDDKQAKALNALLVSAERDKDMAPSRMTRSRSNVGGEDLTKNTSAPVDRETSAPLAEIIFPDDNDTPSPIFNNTVTDAISSVMDEWGNASALSQVGLEPPMTCLIYGPPGTGKTKLAMWMAKELGLPVVLVKLDGLISSFLGTTSRNIGNLFSFANRYRSLLLLDEFDSIAKLRDDPQEVGEIKRVVNALLQNLDSRKDIGFTIGITNHASLLDPAVWRRFEIQLEIPKPDFAVRSKIAANFMPPVKAPDSHVRLISWFTEGCTGAEIESLVRTYKRSQAVTGGKERGLLDTLQQFATLNSGRIGAERRALLNLDAGKLFKAMKADRDLSLTLAEIGEIAGKDKSTISRQIGSQPDEANATPKVKANENG